MAKNLKKKSDDPRNSPSRWVQLCKAALSVALGNIGLVSFVKMEECRGNLILIYKVLILVQKGKRR